jgi:hypothetical protein
MNDKRKLAKALGDDDVAYLADAYDLDKATVRGFNDDEWCQFFGCSSDELSYYLFDESSAVFADQELENDFDTDNFAFDQDSLFDIEPFIEEEIMRKPTALATKPKPASEYSRPSVFAHTAKPSTGIPHYFELVK